MSRTYAQVAVRITLILGVVAFLLYVLVLKGLVGGATFATGSGQGGLEMKIDSKVIYNGVYQPALSWALKDLVPGVDRFFNFPDVKPGDTGTSTISIHIKKNPAYVCLDFVNLKNKENGINEPESYEDLNGTTTGELAKGLEFFAWRDDGDNRYEVGEKPLFGTSTQSGIQVLNNTTYTLADSKYGSPYAKNSTHYIGITWCAGNIAVSTTTAKITCDGEMLGNEAQTDSMSVDIRLRAVEANGSPKFMCVPEKKKCDSKDKHSKDKDCKGNNGHGNDEDGNDDSNPGHSNDEDDDTDDDGKPGWHVVEKGHWGKKFVQSCKNVWHKFRA